MRRQLRASVLQYLSSDRFHSDLEVDVEQVRALMKEAPAPKTTTQ